MPMEETFYATRFSQLRDQFGASWSIIHERPQTLNGGKDARFESRLHALGDGLVAVRAALPWTTQLFDVSRLPATKPSRRNTRRGCAWSLVGLSGVEPLTSRLPGDSTTQESPPPKR
jgi:hypothetical protein